MHTRVFGEVKKDSYAEADFGVGWEMLRLSPTSSAITCPPCVLRQEATPQLKSLKQKDCSEGHNARK